jgi:hypothetical protein
MKRQIFIHGQLHKQPELQSIIKKHGMGGLGLSVMIIEVLADRDYTSNEIHLIAKELEEDLEQVEDIILNHDLFKIGINQKIECLLAYFIQQN